MKSEIDINISKAYLLAWAAYVSVLTLAIFLIEPSRPNFVVIGSQFVSATIAIYLISKTYPRYPDFKLIAPWSVTGFSLCMLMPMVLPSGYLAENQTLLNTIAAAGVASIILPITCFVLLMLIALAKRALDCIIN